MRLKADFNAKAKALESAYATLAEILAEFKLEGLEDKLEDPKAKEPLVCKFLNSCTHCCSTLGSLFEENPDAPQFMVCSDWSVR